MNNYKNITGKQRLASLKITKEAIESGQIPKPSKCKICGKTTGRIDYHNETYNSPIDGLIMICQGCHMRWHNRHRFRDSFIKFFIESDKLGKLNEEMMFTLKNEGFVKQ